MGRWRRKAAPDGTSANTSKMAFDDYQSYLNFRNFFVSIFLNSNSVRGDVIDQAAIG
jgi:hypothetical protein